MGWARAPILVDASFPHPLHMAVHDSAICGSLTVDSANRETSAGITFRNPHVFGAELKNLLFLLGVTVDADILSEASPHVSRQLADVAGTDLDSRNRRL
jgi:hypothetical protein